MTGYTSRQIEMWNVMYYRHRLVSAPSIPASYDSDNTLV